MRQNGGTPGNKGNEEDFKKQKLHVNFVSGGSGQPPPT